jgi:hypothetical protein
MASAAGHFYAAGTSGLTFGVHAENDSSTTGAAALYGHAGTNDGEVYGVQGYSTSNSADSAAVYGYSRFNGYGVYGLNESTSNGARAGFFHAAGTTGNTYGLVVQNDSATDQSRAGHFWANADSGQTYGVVGLNDSLDSASVAGYFRATGGVGLHVRADAGNSIEAYSSATERTFYVDNVGDVYIDGAYHDAGADFAEMLPAVEGLEPGDVLVVGPDGQLARSVEAYAAAVVGVYSTKPAFVGGSDEKMENPGQVPLAVVGVVPVKASAENGPIQPGDLLTTASLPGHAMRCEGVERCFGRTLGKALGSLEEGTGTILVLVMLQ